MRYGSVCSGIDAVKVAWDPLDWECAFQAEIDKFPSAVLAHHYPEIRNHGDFTKITGRRRADRIDLLVGGTPCQSFSVAGLRGGMADPRGNLALEFLALARRLRPRWVVWENVPGVLSSITDDAPDAMPPGDNVDVGPGVELVVEDEYDCDETHAFACFLAGLSELGYGYAYRILDAQYFGVPQRRRRVFVVAYLGDWRYPAAVLFERACLRGDPPPSREAGEDVAPSVTGGPPFSRTGNERVEAESMIAATLSPTLRARANSSHRADSMAYIPEVSHACTAKGSASGYQDPTAETYIAGSLCNNGKASGSATQQDAESGLLVPIAFHGRQDPDSGDVAHPVDTDGHSLAICFSDPRRHDDEHRGGVREMPCVNPSNNDLVAFTVSAQSNGFAWEKETAPTLQAHPQSDTSDRQTGVRIGMQVRRLVVEECERLQGLPPGYTRIPWRGKPAEQCPDGPRYKAIGNSMAVPCMFWLGKRIQMVEDLCR